MKASKGSHDSHATPQSAPNPLPCLLETEIAAAKARLADAMATSSLGAISTASNKPGPRGANFHSHRAGIDAFMTGFIFTCYALQATCEGGVAGGNRHDLSGLADMKNCLASRRRGQHHLPLTIFKSNYARNSTHFTSNKEKLLAAATPTTN